MSDEFKLPDIGEGLAEGEIVKWLVAVGDAVAEDQPLVEVMTDKATVEVPSPRAGTVAELRAAEGDIIAIGTTILVFGDGDGAEASPEPTVVVAEERPQDDSEEAPETAPERFSGPEPLEPTAVQAAEAAEAPVEPSGGVSVDEIAAAREVARAERVAVESPAGAKPWEAPAIPGGAVAPAARRLAAELGVDVARVSGSGPKGLVTKQDVRAVAGGGPAGSEVPPQDAPATVGTAPVEEAAATAAAATVPVAASSGGEERIPLRGLRRTIARRMVEATTTVPHYTYVEEVDMTEVVALRQEAKAKAAEQGIKLTYLPFIIRALVLALKNHPYVNASLDDDAGEIILKRYYNIGIATNTERGLMVPVIKDADKRDLFDLAAEIGRLSSSAREGTIKLDDLQGGTFTISSTGNIGGQVATPVINLPEVAILGVTAIRERPVVRNGEVVIRNMVNFSLSCDHRVVDGAIAAYFVRDMVKFLEDPKLQLLADL